MDDSNNFTTIFFFAFKITETNTSTNTNTNFEKGNKWQKICVQKSTSCQVENVSASHTGLALQTGITKVKITANRMIGDSWWWSFLQQRTDVRVKESTTGTQQTTQHNKFYQIRGIWHHEKSWCFPSCIACEMLLPAVGVDLKQVLVAKNIPSHNPIAGKQLINSCRCFGV